MTSLERVSPKLAGGHRLHDSPYACNTQSQESLLFSDSTINLYLQACSAPCSCCVVALAQVTQGMS